MQQHYTPAHHPHPILTDPSHLAGHPSARHMGHPGPSHFGAGPAQHAVVAPLYSSLTPTHGQTAGMKRPRPDDLDLSVPGMPDLEHGDLGSIQQTPMGAPYAPPPSAQSQQPPTHHHHRLPDTGPPNKLLRRDGDGNSSVGGGGVPGAPSMVGAAGMPAPAARPRGPKLKFTPEDDQLLIDLKENKNLTWKQIADFFPGRSSGTLQVRYCTKLKAKTTQWTDETVKLLFSYSSFFRFNPDACRPPGRSPYGCFTNKRYPTGSKATYRTPGLRKRKMAHHRQQGRHGIYADCLPRESRGAIGGELIATSVSSGTGA